MKKVIKVKPSKMGMDNDNVVEKGDSDYIPEEDEEKEDDNDVVFVERPPKPPPRVWDLTGSQPANGSAAPGEQPVASAAAPTAFPLPIPIAHSPEEEENGLSPEQKIALQFALEGYVCITCMQ